LARHSREEAGLPSRGFVFCCFNNNYKIAPLQFAAWMRILKRVQQRALAAPRSATVESNLRREAAARGVDPAARVLPAVSDTRIPRLLAYRPTLLDTLPFNAGATASDALWAAPVLSCAGQGFRVADGRACFARLVCRSSATDTMEAYEALACRLANDARLCRAIRTS
jgi:predicted O-linked N-acetylglucosamine transferase (SPINDLY family)